MKSVHISVMKCENLALVQVMTPHHNILGEVLARPAKKMMLSHLALDPCIEPRVVFNRLESIVFDHCVNKALHSDIHCQEGDFFFKDITFVLW